MRTPTRSPRFPPRWLVAMAIMALCLLGSAWAQSADDPADPPARVARLSYLAGDVGVLPQGAHDWSAASVNRPLTDGARITTGGDARAELELGGATLHVDGDTDLGVLALNDQLGQFELTRGTLELGVRHLADGQSYEIDTPSVALVMDQPGRFRVDIGADGRSATVTALQGGAVVFGANGAQQDVLAGRRYRFDDDSLREVAIGDMPGGDAFDAWCDDRDRRYTDAMSTRYVSTEVVGAEDLDNYGEWTDEPDYGAVWFPARVVVGWAPYRFGHWAWIAPWGWTWVDDAPWGFAPFHYGRWAYIRGAWGWIPGPRHIRPVYAPALVAFVGGGRHWGVSLRYGAPVGWFPLGPRDFYNPWYHASRNYYARVNRSDLDGRRGARDFDARIARHYEDFRRGHAAADHLAGRPMHGFTAVPGRSFADAHDVHRHRLHVDPQRLAHAPIDVAGAGIRPDLRAQPPRSPRLRALPTEGVRRAVVMHHAPADHRFARVTHYNVPHPDYRQAARAAAQPPGVRPAMPRADVRAFRGNGATLPSPPRLVNLRDAAGSGEPSFARDTHQARETRRDNVQRPGLSIVGRGSSPGTPTRTGSEELPRPPHVERMYPLPRDSVAHESAARFEAARRMADQRPPPSSWHTRVDAPPRSYNDVQPHRFNDVPLPRYNHAPHPDYRAPAYHPPRVQPEHRAPPTHAGHRGAAPPRPYDEQRH